MLWLYRRGRFVLQRIRHRLRAPIDIPLLTFALVFAVGYRLRHCLDRDSRHLTHLAHMIHERFCCNRLPVPVRTQTGRFTTATSLLLVGVSRYQRQRKKSAYLETDAVEEEPFTV